MVETAPKSSEKDVQAYYLDKSWFATHNSKYCGENTPDGTDYQGIAWKTYLSTPRKTFRQLRNIAYKPFRQLKEDILTKYPYKEIRKEEPYYRFEKFYRVPQFWYGHFQLKSNLLIPNKTDLIYPSKGGFVRHSLNDFKKTEYKLDMDLNPVTMDFQNGLIGIGTQKGKLVIYGLDKQEILYDKGIGNNNSQNNCVSFFPNKSFRNMRIGCGGEDKYVKIFDINENQVKSSVEIATSHKINAIKASPDGNLLLLLQNKKEVEIVDLRNKMTVAKFFGHEDYGFAGDWHPNGIQVATGNQDCTCRIWDMRNSKAVNILQAHLGNVSTVRYSNSGEYLVVGENIDYTSVYNVGNYYEDMQVIDYFGEILGMGFDPENGESLFLAVMLKNQDGVFEFNVKKAKHMDSLANFMF